VTRILLDAGAFIALDRNDRKLWRRIGIARDDGIPLLTHAGVLAQVWRKPRRQALLIIALRSVRVVPFDSELAKSAGDLLAESGRSDVVDAALVTMCRAGDVIYTSDPDDIDLLVSYGKEPEIDVVSV
jgi:hypothetical protein